MSEKKRPIQRSLLLGCTAFILILCLLLTVQSYLQFSVALYRQSQVRLKTVIQFVDEHLDREDLRNCINTRKASVKYYELQSLMKSMVEPFELANLYICYPSGSTVITVASAVQVYRGEMDEALLRAETGYPKEAVALYQKAWKVDEITYFMEKSDYGSFYTGCLPLKTGSGSTFALLFADVNVDGLSRSVLNYAVVSAAIAVALGLLFAVLLLSWLRRNVTGPVLELEKSARRFAEANADVRDIRRLKFEPPEIHDWNEVASLSEAVARMTEDIKKHVEELYSAEVRAKSAELEAEDMSRIAYQDALTHVKNKTAYNVKAKELSDRLQRGRVEFAIVMVDVNYLKRVNDTYGHEYGDKYLVGCCEIICDVYKHSPVYRVGGDEFLVVLQGQDYERRDELLELLSLRFGDDNEDESLQPWERFSAACGMGVHQPGQTVEEVFNWADEEMYRRKAIMKSGR